MRPHAGKFLQRREHVERRGVAVRILAVREQARLLAFLAARRKEKRSNSVSGADPERNVALQRFTQRLAANLGDVRSA